MEGVFMRIKEMPQQNRPRERLILQGEKSLSDAELIAIILQSGTRSTSALDVANKLLSSFTRKELINASLSQLQKIKGIGLAKACQIKALLEFMLRFSLPDTEKSLKIVSPENVYNLMSPLLRGQQQENVYLLSLDSRKKLIGKHLLFRGTLNESIVHPREVFKVAAVQSASAIILVHNHPSGDPTPSEEDKEITSLVQNLGDMMSIPLIDHVIIANCSYFSFKERNLML